MSRQACGSAYEEIVKCRAFVLADAVITPELMLQSRFDEEDTLDFGPQ